MRSTSAAPERIVLFGLPGVGKTRAWADIADQYRSSGTAGTFWVMSPERGSVARLSDGYEDFYTNVTAAEVTDWVSLEQATKAALGAAGLGDWIVVENMAWCWDAIQAAYEDHWCRLQGFVRTDLFSDAPLDESPARWQRINAAYRRWIDPLLASDAHVMVTAPERKLTLPTGKPGEWADGKDLVNLYQRIAVRPDSQKGLSHQMHTVLHLRNPRLNEWAFLSVKDRERSLVEDAGMVTFPLSYLVQIGRWEP